MNRTRVYRIVEIVAAGAFVVSAAIVAFAPLPSPKEWQAAAFFTGFGVLASLLGYKTSDATVGSIGFLSFLSIAIISPSVAGLATVFASILAAEILARREPIKATFNVAQHVLAQGASIAIYVTLGGESTLGSAPPVFAFIAAVATFLTINKLAVSTVVAAASGIDARGHWMRSMRSSLVYDLAAFPLILFFVMAYDRMGPQWSAALALPMLGMRQLYKSNVVLQRINEELMQLMVAAIEARDPYTSGHSQRVARYARVIAKAAGVGSRTVERVAVAALLHDVGKIHEEFAPILRKPGRLTDEEYAVMKTHSEKSSRLVGKVSHFADLVPAVRSHHEAWDGHGYPDELVGTQIPLGARIIAVADTIDAMSTSRPYRNAMTSDDVRDELRRESGRQFDPRLIAALLKVEIWSQLTAEIESATAEYPVIKYDSLHSLTESAAELQLAASQL